MRAGLKEFERHRAHDEGKAGRFPFGRLEQRAVIGADQAQIIGAPALHVAQIIGVIDDAGEVGVLIVDAHGENVPPSRISPSRGTRLASVIV